MLEMGYVALEEHEKLYDGMWRIFNGEEWVHAFRTEEEALERAEYWGGAAVGLAQFSEESGMNEYIKVKPIKHLGV